MHKEQLAPVLAKPVDVKETSRLAPRLLCKVLHRPHHQMQVTGSVEHRCAHAKSSLVVVHFDELQCLLLGHVQQAYARCPMAVACWCRRHYKLNVLFLLRLRIRPLPLGLDSALCCVDKGLLFERCVSVVLRLHHHKLGLEAVRLHLRHLQHLARRVPQRDGCLVQHSSKPLQCHNAQSVSSNGHQALGALLRRETRGVLQAFVREGGQHHARLPCVHHPRSAGQGQTCGAAPYLRLEQLDGSRSKKPLAGVGEGSSKGIQYSTLQHSVLEANVQVQSCVGCRAHCHAARINTAPCTREHVDNGYGLRSGGQHLQRQHMKVVLHVQRHHSHAVVHAPYSQKTRAGATRREGSDSKSSDLLSHVLFLHLVQLSRHVELKMHKFTTAQCNHHLALVKACFGNALFPRGLPLLYTPICPNMPNTIGMYLQ
mmetsp:Transcript_33157/g.53758  ORF Transcript_33157/g.53758 Transcript_33157/m.53758 type:complete len:427 (-) Transcript_33157:1590-2870(-)